MAWSKKIACHAYKDRQKISDINSPQYTLPPLARIGLYQEEVGRTTFIVIHDFLLLYAWQFFISFVAQTNQTKM